MHANQTWIMYPFYIAGISYIPLSTVSLKSFFAYSLDISIIPQMLCKADLTISLRIFKVFYQIKFAV